MKCRSEKMYVKFEQEENVGKYINWGNGGGGEQR